MYEAINANKRRTAVLIVLFIIIIVGLGFLYDYLYGYGRNGLLLAIFISTGMTLVSYYSADRVALWSAGATSLVADNNPYLYHVVENLCITDGLPIPKLYTIPDLAINAFATGRDPKHASIAVTLGALERLEKSELEGVLAHELSHIKNYDIRVMTIVVVLVGAISLFGNWMYRANFFGTNRGRDDRKGGGGIFEALGLVLLILSPLIATLIQLAVSREREYLADASGSLVTRYPEGLARALEKIAKENQPLRRATEATAHLYIANPFGNKKQWLATLFSTHPPIAERIKRLRTMGA